MVHAFARKEQSFGQHVQIPLGEWTPINTSSNLEQQWRKYFNQK